MSSVVDTLLGLSGKGFITGSLIRPGVKGWVCACGKGGCVHVGKDGVSQVTSCMVHKYDSGYHYEYRE